MSDFPIGSKWQYEQAIVEVVGKAINDIAVRIDNGQVFAVAPYQLKPIDLEFTFGEEVFLKASFNSKKDGMINLKIATANVQVDARGVIETHICPKNISVPEHFVYKKAREDQ